MFAVADVTQNHLTDGEQYNLQQRARKSKLLAAALGVLLSPLAYSYTGSNKLALINLLTINYLCAGFVLVPIHAWLRIRGPQKKLTENGVEW